MKNKVISREYVEKNYIPKEKIKVTGGTICTIYLYRRGTDD